MDGLTICSAGMLLFMFVLRIHGSLDSYSLCAMSLAELEHKCGLAIIE
jgi:hypothetical protein